MHRPTDPVTHELAHHIKSVALNVILNRPRYIHDPSSHNCLANALVKCPLRYIHQLLGHHATTARSYRLRGVTDEPVVNHPDVQAYDVPKLQLARPSKAMNY